MSAHENEKKFEVAIYTLLPISLMLFIEMALNTYFAPTNSIFISPYVLAYFICVLISLVVLLKGQICPGQKARLTFVFRFLALFALGHLIYTITATPKHIPLNIANITMLMLPLLYWKLPEDETLYKAMLYCGFGMVAIGTIQYLAVYWFELPSLFNGIRANNFAQILFGILLAGWLLMVAKSRLDGFFKLLIKLAMLVLVINYCWVIFVLYQQLNIMPDIVIYPYFIYFAGQFVILLTLAWLLFAKNIKNPTAWSLATGIAMLYPLTNLL